MGEKWKQTKKERIKKKERKKTRENNYAFNPTHFCEWFFTCSLVVSISKLCVAQTIYNIEIMLVVKCHFLKFTFFNFHYRSWCTSWIAYRNICHHFLCKLVRKGNTKSILASMESSLLRSQIFLNLR